MADPLEFYDRNDMYVSPDFINFRIDNCDSRAFFVISLITINEHDLGI